MFNFDRFSNFRKKKISFQKIKEGLNYSEILTKLRQDFKFSQYRDVDWKYREKKNQNIAESFGEIDT